MDSIPSTFVCPLHPNVRRLGPGTCPKCGAELTERTMRTGIFRDISNPTHIVVTLLLMLAVMAVGLWWIK